MRIAVLGTGMVGRALAGRLDELDHDVTVGTRDVSASMSRPAESGPSFADWVNERPGVAVATYEAAARDAEVVVNATTGQATIDALTSAGLADLGNVIVIDIANPLDFSAGFPPTLSVLDTDSLGEQVQAAFPEARVVKALNTLTAELMVHPRQLADGAHTVFVSGNDVAAKAIVTELLTSMGHTDVIDLGDLSTCRGTEMYLQLWLRLMGALGTPLFSIAVVRPD